MSEPHIQPLKVVIDVGFEIERAPLLLDPTPGMVCVLLNGVPTVWQAVQNLLNPPQAILGHGRYIWDRAACGCTGLDSSVPPVNLECRKPERLSHLVQRLDVGVQRL